MSTTDNAALVQFKNLVGIKFQLYNSLFTSLPFHRIEKTGILIPLLLLNCEDGYKKGLSPVEIMEEFFLKQTLFNKDEEKVDLLFRLVQYIERQVVLFDALEDAAFKQVHDPGGAGTLKHLALQAGSKNRETEIAAKLKDFSTCLVLTAHPTQFYRGAVLGIIHDLSSAVHVNNENQIYTYLQQLGRTPFFQKQKPTPYDEAISLIWYLENIFYNAIGRIISFLRSTYPDAGTGGHALVKMGFWPGGDRDGNPFVNASTTLKVADALRGAVIKCYYSDVRKLKRRLTFKGVDIVLADLEKKLYDNLFIPGHQFDLGKEDILKPLRSIHHQLIYEHSGLFVDRVVNLINKVEVFGLHFASLDIRQDSSVHTKLMGTVTEKTGRLPKNYATLPENEKIKALLNINTTISPEVLPEAVEKDALDSVDVIKTIQQLNGEAGCSRYIISQCSSAVNVIEVFGLFLLGGWKKEELTVDIVPLFETVTDLQHAAGIMKQLYELDDYRKHLQLRGNKQTIMVGFSDGTKDGSYLMANWSIYKAKEELTAVSKAFGIDVIFFDGRGGPPARGGGKTHNFYASQGKDISNKEIQLTIQGQTISSKFGTIDSAQYYIEQLLHAGISNEVFPTSDSEMLNEEAELIQRLAEEGYESYKILREHPYFADYLVHASPLRFYADTNIGSRPAKRGGASKLTLKDLRAIPFVGAWSQIKQNVTGYYGVGIAFEKLANEGRWAEVKKLYDHSLFFRTLIDNCEMSMTKCYFPLTAFLAKHPLYGDIWNMIHEEFERTRRYILLLTEKDELMAKQPVEKLSIQMRERIVLPLLTIQQYAITKVRELEEREGNEKFKAVYEKLAMRCSFGIINAARNSA